MCWKNVDCLPGDGILKNGSQICFALGLAVLSLATAVCQFVIWGLLAWPLVLVALTLLVIGIIGVKGTEKQSVSRRRQVVGLALLVVGVAALLVVAWETSLMAYEAAKHWERPSQPALAIGSWVLVATEWMLPAAFIALGFWRWTGWSFSRCLCWAIAVLFVCPAALLLFGVLHMYWFRVTN
jgi:hypothetical protein